MFIANMITILIYDPNPGSYLFQDFTIFYKYLMPRGIGKRKEGTPLRYALLLKSIL
jgi:hypothetical protein